MSPNHLQQRGSTVTGIIIGLLLGLGIALGVAFFVNKQKSPYVDRMNHPVEGIEKPASAKLEDPKPVDPSAKPAAVVGDKPRFDYHQILSDGKVATPNLDKSHKNQHVIVNPAPVAAQPIEKPVPEEPGTKYYLQVGAFNSETDADNLKARIALIGLQAEVKAATVQDKGVMHRVRLGPYKTHDEMSRARDDLTQNGLPSSVITIKPKS
ncbi:MAG: SPOR domain-containing protein [Burkholderiales bacterium]